MTASKFSSYDPLIAAKYAAAESDLTETIKNLLRASEDYLSKLDEFRTRDFMSLAVNARRMTFDILSRENRGNGHMSLAGYFTEEILKLTRPIHSIARDAPSEFKDPILETWRMLGEMLALKTTGLFDREKSQSLLIDILDAKLLDPQLQLPDRLRTETLDLLHEQFSRSDNLLPAEVFVGALDHWTGKTLQWGDKNISAALPYIDKLCQIYSSMHDPSVAGRNEKIISILNRLLEKAEPGSVSSKRILLALYVQAAKEMDRPLFHGALSAATIASTAIAHEAEQGALKTSGPAGEEGALVATEEILFGACKYNDERGESQLFVAPAKDIFGYSRTGSAVVYAYYPHGTKHSSNAELETLGSLDYCNHARFHELGRESRFKQIGRASCRE